MHRNATKALPYARQDVTRREPAALDRHSALLGRDAPLMQLRTAAPSTSLTLLSTVLVVIHALCFTAAAQTGVQDIFGRSLNQRGITLVDREGYLANPLIKFYVLPPTNALLPGSATLTVNGARLYFDTPSNVSASGPGKTTGRQKWQPASDATSIWLRPP